MNGLKNLKIWIFPIPAFSLSSFFLAEPDFIASVHSLFSDIFLSLIFSLSSRLSSCFLDFSTFQRSLGVYLFVRNVDKAFARSFGSENKYSNLRNASGSSNIYYRQLFETAAEPSVYICFGALMKLAIQMFEFLSIIPGWLTVLKILPYRGSFPRERSRNLWGCADVVTSARIQQASKLKANDRWKMSRAGKSQLTRGNWVILQLDRVTYRFDKIKRQ